MRSRRKKSSHAPPPDAVFIGWQTTTWGVNFPLYNITVDGHPRFGSTITGRELRRLRLRVPPTPAGPGPRPDAGRRMADR